MKKQQKHVVNSKKVQDIAATLKNAGKHGIPSDVSGSYTGVTIDDERPVQDADDL